MKKMILIFVSFWLMTAFVIAQAPQAFKYQAVARNSSGNLIQYQLVAFRITLLQGGPSGTLVYQERHTTNTNNYGLANLDIGNGTVLAGTFDLIDWSAGSMFIKVELDPLGGTAYQDLGAAQLLSVPYALYSERSSELKLPFSGSSSNAGNSLTVTNAGTGNGIRGITSSNSGFGLYGTGIVTGVKGEASVASGESYGVYGIVSSLQGYGVFGKATAISGYNYGVYGESQSIIGTGVYGLNSTLSGGWCSGVMGKSTSSTGMGVYGIATSATGQTRGIRGYVASPDGFSGYFEGGKFFVDGTVGIGTESPSRTLSVHAGNSGSSANFINNYTGGTSTDGLVISCAATLTGYLINYENAALIIGTNNQYDNIVIQSNGNIGIGTATPAYLLDVGGVVNLNKGISSGIALRCNGDEAMWYNNTYFSWGYAGTYNFFGNKLKIAGNGNVAPTYELQVDGNAAKSLGGSAWIVSSDLRLKNLLGNYTKGLDEIIALQPVKFTYKEYNQRDLTSGLEQIGFVAQDVQKIFPEAVKEGEDGYLDFNMHPVNVALINAIKELNEKIVSLEEENNELKTASEDMKARLSIIEAGMSLSSKK
jgi:hypothetical protein